MVEEDKGGMADESQAIADSGPQPGAADVPEAPSGLPTEPVAAASPGGETAPATEPASPDGDPEADFYRRLEALDPDELLKRSPGLKRKLDGRVGEVADKLARDRLARLQAEAEERQRMATLTKLAEDDPYALAEEWKKIAAERERVEAVRQEQERLAAQTYESVDTFIRREFYELPYPVQVKLSQRVYEGTPDEARLQFARDKHKALMEYAAEEHEKALAPKLAEQRRLAEEAAKKEALGEVLGSEASPDVGGGHAAVDGAAVTWEALAAHSGDNDWFRRNEARINKLLASQPRRPRR
jgi:hypothetical protein